MKKNRIRSGAARRKAKKDYCEVCNNKEDVDLHHIIYKSEYGSDAKFNLVNLCYSCHRKKAHKEIYPKDFLFYIVAIREGMLLDEVIKRAYRLVPRKRRNKNV